MTNKKKIIIGLFVTLLLIYFAGVGVFSQKTYPTTKFDGQSVGMIDRAGLEKFLKSNFTEVTISISDDVVSDYSPKISDLGASIDAESLANTLNENQSAWTWPVSMFTHQDYDLTEYITVDDGTLNGKLTDAGIIGTDGRTKSKNATMGIDEESSEYVITDEVYGTVVNDDFVADLSAAIASGATEFDATEYYKQPSIKAEDLQSDVDALNTRINRDITVNYGDNTLEIPKAKRATFVMLDDDGNVTVDNTTLYNYLFAIAEDFATVSEGSGSRTVTGYDVDNAYYAIENALLTDEEGAITTEASTVTYDQDPLQSSIPTSGTYIEVSITNQYLWLYNDGELVIKTPVVTGSVASDWDTPTGTFKVWNKETDKVLDGATVGYDYEVPVDYWMAVDYTGVGIHDIDWLTSDIAEDQRSVYKTNGSHGCVNVPNDVMKTVYNNTPIGTPVYITP